MTRVTRKDEDGDGIDDNNVSHTYTYDGAGNNVFHLIETDSDADGTTDIEQAYIYHHDDYGNITREDSLYHGHLGSRLFTPTMSETITLTEK